MRIYLPHELPIRKEMKMAPTLENPYIRILRDEKFEPTVQAVQDALQDNGEFGYDLCDATFMAYHAIADLVDCEIAAGGAALEDEEVDAVLSAAAFKFDVNDAARAAVCAAVKNTFWCVQ